MQVSENPSKHFDIHRYGMSCVFHGVDISVAMCFLIINIVGFFNIWRLHHFLMLGHVCGNGLTHSSKHMKWMEGVDVADLIHKWWLSHYGY